MIRKRRFGRPSMPPLFRRIDEARDRELSSKMAALFWASWSKDFSTAKRAPESESVVPEDCQ